MGILNSKTVKDLEKIFADFNKTVTVKFFGKSRVNECRYCKETRELLEGVSGISDKIKLEIFDFEVDAAAVAEFGITRAPAVVVMDEKDYGIRFYGVPAGYEFSSLIESFKLVAGGESPLAPETRQFLDALDKNIHLQVFVTPTCPYCPGAVVLAHRMAFYSPKVKADMVEASEFPELSQKYNVMGVPRTIINETIFLEGAAPENELVNKIKEVGKD